MMPSSDAFAAVNRRETLAAGLAIAAAPTLLAAKASDSSGDLRLWYRQPAGAWTEALPVGNGRLGAMVFGRVAQERLQLNEDTLWAGAPYDPDNLEALAALPEVRALLAAGRYRDATDLASAKMMGKPPAQMPYGTLGDLLLTFASAKVPTAYRRELDLASGIATTEFETADGRYRRELFASAPDQVIVMRLEAEGGTLDFDLAYRAPRAISTPRAQFSEGAKPQTTRPTEWLQREDADRPGPDVTIAADGAHALLVTGSNEAALGAPAGLRYALRVQAVGDGVIVANQKGITVSGARSVTLLIAAATSYRRYDDTGGDPVGAVRAAGQAVEHKAYHALQRSHVTDHAALFGGVKIDLGTSPAAALPTDERIAAGASAVDPALAALYLQYGRYLLIASSRPGSQPSTLQGIWNEGTTPPWGSKYTININTEMNYWAADPGGLGLCVEPLVRMVEDLSVTGARTARTMYGARGWVAHHNTDLWRATAPIDGPLWGLWPCGGAWLCNTLFTHWDFARDPALLARLYPLLKGAAHFFVDTLIEDPKGRGLVTSPSLSPENEHPFGSSLCVGPAMDRQIVRDLFNNTIAAGRKLGRDTEWLAMLEQVGARIAPDRIGAAGQLQEWLEDWDAQAPDQHHRHVSHLYAVYPSGQINVRDTPALIEAAKVSLRQRGDLSTGWATAWRVCLWARMGEGDHAYTVLKGLLGPQRTYPNMFDAHPPFQIDGNFGGAAGILEMLVQSWGGELHLLPALPTAWPDGSIAGVRARGGVRVDLTWRQGRATALTLSAPAGSTVKIRLGTERFAVTIPASGRYMRHWA
ncbi:alpha-L-fucosidase 2 [Sphingomonas sp. BE270]|jgi:alpha-L-fucosidase 2|uniref:glycoside hydrolase family 95 protein n=3 Tax=Sphingomonas TaxID=13687 RepID=UPI0020166FD2|nr:MULTISPECIES: glycoside hydrolase family 95 protein [unclassified Sphingomonas]MDR6847777.1 alpha-L-fucosidase 2 [Sphingomonas sp. BE137]MDR7259179.1 alpha-L-fucosidase 2 [Sphingomonas sp. BE270]